MMFSIIIPTYNRKKYVKEAIDSVLNQDFSDFEIILVDDGSTDNTNKMLSSIESKKIRVISYRENYGTNYARNIGIANSKGEYIAFLDSDDTLIEGCLNNVAKTIKTHPEAKQYWFKCIDSISGEIYNEQMPENFEKIDFDKQLLKYKGDFFRVVAKDCFKEVRFEEKLKGFEGITWLHIIKECNLTYYFDIPAVSVRRNMRDSLSKEISTHSKQNHLNRYKGFNRYLELLGPDIKSTSYKLYVKILIKYIVHTIILGKYKEAQKSVKEIPNIEIKLIFSILIYCRMGKIISTILILLDKIKKRH